MREACSAVRLLPQTPWERPSIPFKRAPCRSAPQKKKICDQAGQGGTAICGRSEIRSPPRVRARQARYNWMAASFSDQTKKQKKNSGADWGAYTMEFIQSHRLKHHREVCYLFLADFRRSSPQTYLTSHGVVNN